VSVRTLEPRSSTAIAIGSTEFDMARRRGKSPTASILTTATARTKPTRLARPVVTRPAASRVSPADATTSPIAVTSVSRAASKMLCSGTIDHSVESPPQNAIRATRMANGRRIRGNVPIRRGLITTSPIATAARSGANPSGATKPTVGAIRAAPDRRFVSDTLRVRECTVRCQITMFAVARSTNHHRTRLDPVVEQSSYSP
jgi:hypothetical protein